MSQPNTLWKRLKLDDDSFEAGDFVFVLVQKPQEQVARIEHIRTNAAGEVGVTVAWCYRPEDTVLAGGRLFHHGVMEIFTGSHMDIIPPESILGKCRVVTLQEYEQLKGPATVPTFFLRSHYDQIAKVLNEDHLHRECVCQRPENPDLLMVGCDHCFNWFHIECVGLNVDKTELEAPGSSVQNALPTKSDGLEICQLVMAELRTAH